MKSYPSRLVPAGIHLRTLPWQKAALVFYCFLSVLLPAMAQEIRPAEKQYLSARSGYFRQLGLPVQAYTYDDAARNRLLSDVLSMENQRQGKLNAGILFAVAAAGLLAAGAAYQPKPGIDGLFDFTKPFLLLGGTGFALGSIPFFVISGKRAWQRDQAIERARLEFLNR